MTGPFGFAVALLPPDGPHAGVAVAGDGTAGPATVDPDPMVGVVVLLVAGVVAAAALRGRSDEVDADGTPDPPEPDVADAAKPAEPADEEPEALSDEDRVVALLEANDGRMKQVNIVEETEWSKSKVSMLLSEMAEDGTISKLRVGRENIISLDGDEPAAAGSPFDDE
ncbi:helix-turn-helix transcriptional regulator [Halostella salina]|uniref:helix-turn-helix transcriptional regulator n=1 Tax=Halostella salina TaxID=1547897 RepID=UPI0035C1AFC2